jgi:hypothetical protein
MVPSSARAGVASPKNMRSFAMQINSKWGEGGSGLLRINTTSHEPKNAAVSIPYKNQWFYIEENDLQSKASFLLIQVLMGMQSGSSSSGAPVLTIPISS